MRALRIAPGLAVAPAAVCATVALMRRQQAAFGVALGVAAAFPIAAAGLAWT